MIAFPCPGCQKKFTVKDELAGKKSKCPNCGKALTVPAEAALAPSGEGTWSPPPADAGASRSGERRRTPRPDAGESMTLPPLVDPDATFGVDQSDTAAGHALTAFLAPPQSGDELGRLGNYRVLSILGHGGMGVVFKAEDTRLKRTVAIKAMLPGVTASASAGQRFLREAQAMAAVEHDHIVRIYQVDEDRGVPYLAMELLKGEPLDECLTREGKLPVPEVLRVGREIAEALAAAHATGLIHRDIKPANVWLESPRARVKILDFGLARAGSQDSNLTQRGAIIGTPAYMAPEQARGETVDARSDLFSLGVVLYRLCTGEQPFKGGDAISTLMEVATHEPAAPRRANAKLPPGLSDLVMKLLEKDPKRRPSSAGEVVEALRSLERRPAGRRKAREDTVAQEARPEKAATTPPRRRWPLYVLVAVLLAGLLGVGAFGLIHFKGEQGDFVIATDDPDFSFRVSKGTVTMEDRKTKRQYDLRVVREDRKEGQYELEVTDPDSGLSFKTKTFTVKRGEKVALKAWFERKPAAAAKGTVDDAWVKRVAGLPAEKQVEAVAAKLKELNPGFDGTVEHKIEDGVVTEIQVVTDQVTDISPLRAFNSLRALACIGTLINMRQGNGQLADLTPLKGMSLGGLRSLDLSGTKVGDEGLDLFKGCTGLIRLKLSLTQVSDEGLAHFKDCTDLAYLHLSSTRVGDAGLAHLKDCTGLRQAYLAGTRVGDEGLALFKGTKNLRWLHIHGTRVSDAGLAHLKGCTALTSLGLVGTQVGDAGRAHLKGCTALTQLALSGTRVGDAGLAHLKGCTALTLLHLSDTKVGDAGLAHLKGCTALTQLYLNGTRVSDAGLAHLKGCTGLRHVNLSHTRVGDLSALKGMGLVGLHLEKTKVKDLSPLKGMPLRELMCDFEPERDAAILRSIKTLEKINNKPAAEFWKEVDAKKP